MFERSWVRILALYTGWTFFTLICCKNCTVCLKRPKINEKGPGLTHFLKRIWYGQKEWMLEASMLLTEVSVHEHWRPQ